MDPPPPRRDSEREPSGVPLDAFFEAVYQELFRIAHGRLSRSTPTLDTVALVHEAYLRLRRSEGQPWRESEHVQAVACTAMRQILRNYLRDRRALKRGSAPPGPLEHDPPDDEALSEEALLARLDGLAALDRIGKTRLRRVAEMRLFGYEVSEVAAVLGVSGPTVKRDWEKARVLLAAYAGSGPPSDASG